ncbi:MAG TPA: polyphosphate kinase 1 [Pyrinomonadaceae bacterium]|nr:polyphosphate kinase 1 [Pyrinomonadaceae bacterium]
MTADESMTGQAGTTDERRAEVGAPATRQTGDPLFFNRELSLIEFFRRVLEEAQDATQPLLERLKFLAILSSNLDEFFMIRVSGLKETLDGNLTEISPDGMTPAEQLAAVRRGVRPLVEEQMRVLREEILPGLRAEGVEVVPYAGLTDDERRALGEYFEENVLPVLTPQAVDPAHPFPYVSNLSLNLALTVQPIPAHGITRSLTGKSEPRFARLKVPPVVPRLVPVGGSKTRFALLDDLIAANVATLFPRMHAGRCYAFRLTRDADIEVREDEANDLLKSMEANLRQRRFGSPVRLEISADTPPAMVEFLTRSFDLTPDDVYKVDGPLNLPALMALYKQDRPDLKDRPLKTTVPAVLKAAESVFDVIRERDVVLHHPYNNYSAVIDFLRQAAHDPDVLAIKMCLYRTGQNSPVPQALIEAIEQGKQVTAIVELKARFDEVYNIEWAKRLEQAGVHVVYGLLGKKIHCKVMLVVRREGEHMRRYVHIATGNYNPVTSSVYTDLSLLTADEEIGADATDLFNFLTGFSRKKEYRRLLVAPANLRERMLSLIERETEHQKAGRPARIAAKINRLADAEIVRALYRASQAGVPVDLVVRGVCMLRPGVPGLSETISVRSIVGRFLEHSRVYYFQNGGDEELYTGSSDWMARNFDRRVEVIAPVSDEKVKSYLRDVVLATYLRDNVKARELQADGSYRRVEPRPGEEAVNSQVYFEGAVSADI